MTLKKSASTLVSRKKYSQMILRDSVRPGYCKVLNRRELVEFVTDGAGTPRVCDFDRER